MKTLLLSLLVFITVNAAAQELSPKEKAEKLAKEQFTKIKYKKKEKFGEIKETKREVISTPVISDVSSYEGNYVYKNLDYKIEIRTDKNKKPIATLSIAGGKDIPLNDVFIKDAFFHAVKQNADGTNEVWEGAFINRKGYYDIEGVEFGLGIKLGTSVPSTEGLNIETMFLKKVSP